MNIFYSFGRRFPDHHTPVHQTTKTGKDTDSARTATAIRGMPHERTSCSH